MTYETLKNMPWQDMLALLARQVESAKNTPPNPNIMRYNLDNIDAPTLFYVGDFEIRARFPDPPHTNPINPKSTTQP